MTLTATKPKKQSNRFKACIFGAPGAGKSHFAYSFPTPYIIDTEGLMKYSHFVDMIKKNDGVVTPLNTIDEIMKEIRALRSEKHDYKTLVIDSLSPVYVEFCNREAVRIAQEKGTEGTEYAINTAKPKRKLAEMAQLLSQIDMNVLLICHSKIKYHQGKEVGFMPDTPDKFEYMLGCVIQVHYVGDNRVGQTIKSRYKELETPKTFELSYKEIKKRFGGEMFERHVTVIKKASPELIAEFKKYEDQGLLTSELKTKWLTVAQVPEIKDMPQDTLEKCIEYMKKQINLPVNGCLVLPK